MKPRAALLLLSLITSAALAGPGHDHGAAAGPSAPSPVEAELSLTLSDVEGKPITGLSDKVSAVVSHDGETEATLRSQAEETPGVYRAESEFAHESDLQIEWKFPVNGKEVAATFPIKVGHSQEESTGAPLLWVWLGIGAAAVILAFILGRATSRSKAAASALLIGILVAGSVPTAQAQDDEHNHDHGGGAAPAEPLQIGIGKLGVLSKTIKIEGVTATFSISVIPPDPTVIRISKEQEELLELKVETLGRDSFGKGLTATGQVVADPSRVASVTSSLSGRLESLTASYGQTVTKGQPLAIVSAPEAAEAAADASAAQSEVLKAQADRQRAQTALAIAKQNVARQQQFAKTGAFSQPTLQIALNELAAAEADVANAQSSLRQAKAEEATHARELARVESLYAEKLASRKELEMALLEAEQDGELVAQAETRLAESLSRLKIDQEAVRREERIKNEGLYNRREIETAKAEQTRAEGDLKAALIEIQGAQATLAAARARVAAFGGKGARVTLTAPIAGTIVKRNASPGEAVEPGQPLLEILDTSEMWFEVALFESDLQRVKVNSPAEVRTDSDPERLHPGFVTNIGRVVDPEKRTASVLIKVSNRDGSLKQNEFARALIFTKKEERALSVPASAIQELGGLKVVFVKTPKGFKRTSVKLGPSANNRFEVLDGLKPGDRVATQGSYQLRMMSAAS